MPQRVLLALALLATIPAAAQTDVGFGADIVSRYVWRGIDFGQSASVQPTIELTSGGFALGTWGSFAITDAGANELDLYASYTAGPFTVGVTDYYFPTDGSPDFGVTSGSDFFNYEEGGAHYIEPFVSYSGGDALPLTITAATIVHNDPEYSTYIEAAYGFAVGETELGLAVGTVVVLDPKADSNGSDFYNTTRNATVMNIALSAGREIPITDQFTLPVFGQLILNPEYDRAFLVFGISL